MGFRSSWGMLGGEVGAGRVVGGYICRIGGFEGRWEQSLQTRQLSCLSQSSCAKGSGQQVLNSK